uniref:C2H2-type domain-containing protein n=1 Tax=Neogobius melanostomus TaxID=47308 RepID=A0A8C6SE76_9GOBI
MKILIKNTTKPDIKDTKTQQDCFPCPHCERRFTCKQGLEQGHHPCNYCTKVFNSVINRQRHERRFHGAQPEVTQDENPPAETNASSQQEELETGQVGQYVLDISSNISENLSFYIDGKLVSASTVHETAEASALVSIDALILKPIQVDDKEPELVTARFKRRTSTPQQNEETPSTNDFVECNLNVELIENHNYACVEQANSEAAEPVKAMKEQAKETDKPLVIGGNSCNQKPLDLSNTVKSSEDVALANAVLDLSVQKKCSEDCEPATTANDSIENIEELNANMAPLVTDFAIVSSSDLAPPIDQVTEGIVYGLIPTNSLSTCPTSLAPVTLQPASPCTIAFASPAPHAVLPTNPSLITVLAPPALPAPSKQPIQVLAPSLSPEPLVICTDNGLNADLTSAITAANSANLVALTQPMDSTLNIPGHVFIADPITLNPPLVESAPVAVNDLNSFNLASNTVLIECTISLEGAGNVPGAIALQENQMEQPTQVLVNHIEQQQIVSVPATHNLDSSIVVSSDDESVMRSTPTTAESPAATEDGSVVEPAVTKDDQESDKTSSDVETSSDNTEKAEQEEKEEDSNDSEQQTFTKNFICNVCDTVFHSMKALGQHVPDHAEKWPYKCEFCMLLFEKTADLLEHRSSLHGVAKTYICSACTKEFVYLCNLKHHQEECHPGQQCTHTEEEKGKLRPPNYNNISKAISQEETKSVKKEESEVATDVLFTTLKIMASDCGKVKGSDVRMGINQHYPSFKPPPFPYHNRSPAASLASATNFTTHNIPQTFSTAIRCTKCGKSFDNMPELHKHILACANASDKRRYTPKRNPIPLRHFAKGQNRVLSTTNTTNGLNTEKLNQEAKMKLLTKRQKKLAQKQGKSMPLSSASAMEMFVCPHCKREFTMRRSRTKHMAVCPKKPAEVKKSRDGIANENNSYRLKGNDKNKLESSAHHKTRLQTGSVKRPAVETIFASKRSKLIIKEGTEATQEIELPIVRTFNPAMRQYSRMHHNIKEIPIKITIVKPQQTEQKSEPPYVKGQEAPASSDKTAAV